MNSRDEIWLAILQELSNEGGFNREIILDKVGDDASASTFERVATTMEHRNIITNDGGTVRWWSTGPWAEDYIRQPNETLPKLPRYSDE